MIGTSAIALSALGAFALAACGTSANNADGGIGGEPTYGDAGILATCSPLSSDCQQNLYCFSATDASGFCTSACTGDSTCSPGACSSIGVCEAVCQPSSDCSTCGCHTGSWCSHGKGCIPLSNVDGPCEKDEDCNSGNCGTFTHTCRVEMGTACTPSTCDVCIVGTSGSTLSFCSRGCQTDEDCEGNGHCVGSGIDAIPALADICKPDCTMDESSCPGTYESCVTVQNEPNERVCACEATYCTDEIANPFGAPCGNSGVCASAACLTADVPGGYGYRGECTSACTTDSQCGSTGACLVDAYADGGVQDGGGACVPTCSASQPCANSFPCVPHTTASGATVSACDPRWPLEGACSTGSACLSGACSAANNCIPAAGSANGAACAASSDCTSNNCLNDVCHGTSQIGGPCTTTDDCSVGTCCTTGECC